MTAKSGISVAARHGARKWRKLSAWQRQAKMKTMYQHGNNSGISEISASA
jgi:hypothetical protein